MKTSKITFDCNEEIHSQAKIKAINSKISLKQYIVDLILNDLKQDENKEHKFIDKDSFDNQLKISLERDSSLMKKLADR